jgi:hypothetical protein
MERRRATRSFGTLPATSREPAHRAEVLAIEALDSLVAKLIKKNDNRVPPEFLDWVGVEATQLAVHIVKKYLENEAFVERMNSDRAEVTVLRVVYQAIMPLVQSRYSDLTGNMTQYAGLGDFQPSGGDSTPSQP